MKKTSEQELLNSLEFSKEKDQVANEKFPDKIPEKNLSNESSQENFQGSMPTKSMVKFWLIGASFVLVGYLFYQSLDIIYLLVAALIISVSSEGLIVSLQKRVKNRGLAIGISYLLILLFVFSGIFLVIPFLITQISLLITRISGTAKELQTFVLGNTRPDAINTITWLPSAVKQYLIENWASFNWANSDFQSSILSSLNTLLDNSTKYLRQFSSSIFSVVWGFLGVMANLTIVFTLAVFFSIEKKYLIGLFLKGKKDLQKQKVQAKIDYVYEKLSLWLKARILLSVFVIIAMYAALWIMKRCGLEIPNMLSLSLITGLMDIIPYIGPIFSIIPLVVLALIYHGFWGMIIAGAVFFAIQWVQNNVITPLLMEKQLGVNSALLIVSALFWATIMGFWGIILSVPLAVIVGLFLDEK